MPVINACSVILTKFCRICLKCSNEVMVDIFEISDHFKTESYKILEKCANVTAHKDDTFPKHICSSCYKLLQNAWTLKTKSEASYKILVSSQEAQKRLSESGNTDNKIADAFISELEQPNVQIEESLHGYIVCLSCYKPFSSKHDLQSHIESCSETCEGCLRTFKNRKDLLNHKDNKCPSTLPSTIKEDDMNTNSVSSIVNGTENKSNVSNIRTNQNRGPLKGSHHERNMASVSTAPRTNDIKRRTRVKNNCGLRLFQRAFKNKAKTQTKNPCICNVCGAKFSRSDTLRFHMEVHDDITHTCEICNNTYLTSRSLYFHKKTHTNLECVYCFKKHHTQQGLDQHMEICSRMDNPVRKRKKMIIPYTHEISSPSKISKKRLKKPANSIESLKDKVSTNVNATKEIRHKGSAKLSQKPLFTNGEESNGINIKLNLTSEFASPLNIAKRQPKQRANQRKCMSRKVKTIASPRKKIATNREENNGIKIEPNDASYISSSSSIARRQPKKRATKMKRMKRNLKSIVRPRRKIVEVQNVFQESLKTNGEDEHRHVVQQPVTPSENKNVRSICHLCRLWFPNKLKLFTHIKDAHI